MSLAPRALYTLLVGELPPPTEQELHHTCEFKHCVQPNHLQLLTDRQHMEIDGRDRAAQSHCKHDHELLGHNLIIRRDGLFCVRTAFRALMNLFTSAP